MDELRRITDGDQDQAATRDAIQAAYSLGRLDGARAAAYYQALVAARMPIPLAAQLTGTYVATIMRDAAREGV